MVSLTIKKLLDGSFFEERRSGVRLLLKRQRKRQSLRASDRREVNEALAEFYGATRVPLLLLYGEAGGRYIAGIDVGSLAQLVRAGRS